MFVCMYIHMHVYIHEAHVESLLIRVKEYSETHRKENRRTDRLPYTHTPILRHTACESIAAIRVRDKNSAT